MSTLPKLCIDVESKDVSYVDIIAPTKVVVLKGISQTLTEVDPYTISPSAYVFGGDGSLRDAFRSIVPCFFPSSYDDLSARATEINRIQ
eukprot:CAMPEP_0184646952 /NCGR_PEP_ID=MMETSP0308-20130426/3779_1 /TAXON_ID=38269 /ORGANISM="Gloeochaete witrockiana, Strain SAG 46.84" /LENGTH=88 /DNA_ID=CAMNT_0027077475 /DNA_START=1000 /DNA_END=1264 /DNA_ORIENTATION=+